MRGERNGGFNGYRSGVRGDQAAEEDSRGEGFEKIGGAGRRRGKVR